MTRLCVRGVSWFLQNEGNWGRLLTTKTWSTIGASHNQLSWAAGWLLVTCAGPVYLAVDKLRPFLLWPLMIGQGGSADLFFDMVSMVLHIGSSCYFREWVWNLRTKLFCIVLGKWNVSRVSLQGFDITYNALGLTVSICIIGLMVGKSEFRYGYSGSFTLRILMKK